MNTKNIDYYIVIEYIFLICVFCLMIWFLNHRIDHLLNSDDASEMVLSGLLTDYGGILSTGWIYSTELRVFHNQIFFVPLFKFINNWHQVRVIGTALLYGLMLSSYWMFCCSFNIRKYFPLSACLLIIPFSWLWFDLILRVSHYIPTIALLFFGISCCELSAKTSSIKKFIALCLLSSTIAFTGGLNGPRQLVVAYLPLLFTLVVLFVRDYVISKKVIKSALYANKRFFDACNNGIFNENDFN